jgi:hypothetical protein
MKNTFTKSLLALGTIAALGAGAGITAIASAADTATTAATTVQAQADPHTGGHVGSNGVKEELLTGDTAAQVTAAALAELPGATVERVETDAEGAAYEAHMTKADGTHVTLKFDSSYAVTATETGPQGPGAAPQAQ